MYVKPILQDNHLLLEGSDDVTMRLLQGGQLDTMICMGGDVNHPFEGRPGEDSKWL